ncbi:MAG: hypothetical protein EBX99_04335 [Acidimicrobiia bacterium]|nr:hypothetical protein [Acidimicrobiia bacterium]
MSPTWPATKSPPEDVSTADFALKVTLVEFSVNVIWNLANPPDAGDQVEPSIAPDEALATEAVNGTTTIDDAVTTRPNKARRKFRNMVIQLALIETESIQTDRRPDRSTTV